MNRKQVDPRFGERGLTLIELMISLLVASLLVGFVFSVHVSLSGGYRSQATVSDLQQKARAARDLLTQSIRTAGFHVTSFQTAHNRPYGVVNAGPRPYGPVQIVDNVDGDANGAEADGLRVYETDPSRVNTIASYDSATNTFALSDVSQFEVDDIVAIVQQNIADIDADGEAEAVFRVCVAQVTDVVNAGMGLEFAETSDWNSMNSSADETDLETNCSDLDFVGIDATINAASFADNAPNWTIEAWKARSFRIDPGVDSGDQATRQSWGILQVNESGELSPNPQPTDWTSLDIGFADLQLASRYWEPCDSVGNLTQDADGDGDPQRDWYSSVNQADDDPALNGVFPDALCSNGTASPAPSLVQVSVSITVKSNGEVTSAPTKTAPAPTPTAGTADNNAFGNHSAPELDLPAASRSVRYRGDFVLRWTSAIVDTRNLGVGI